MRDVVMTSRPTLLCPVDFSEPSRAALRWAAVIADHFGARLVVLTVEDPLLATVAAETGRVPSLTIETERELAHLVEESLATRAGGATTIELRVSVGKPDAEILRVAREERADLVVMSSHGRSGIGKRFFGSTTERVLRATPIPVLVTPSRDEHVVSLSVWSGQVRRVVAPVDLTPASPHQVTVAAGIATAISAPLMLAHVLEPVHVPVSVRLAIPGSDAARRAEAEARLLDLARSAAGAVTTETLVLSGDPSEEIVKLADARGAGLIVIGLHSSGVLGPRMGSITYRVLCLTHALVLALPPVPAASATSSGDGEPAMVRQ
jgi:nucleotide-binding universal stress UspA family protein